MNAASFYQCSLKSFICDRLGMKVINEKNIAKTSKTQILDKERVSLTK